MKQIQIALTIIKYLSISKNEDKKIDINNLDIIDNIFLKHNYYKYNNLYKKNVYDKYEIIFYIYNVKNINTDNIYYCVYFNDGSKYSGGFGIQTFLYNYYTCFDGVEKYANNYYHNKIYKKNNYLINNID